MQIFVPFADPKLNAYALDDKRVVKMCTETAQILSTVMWLQGFKGPYRITHKHHPCVRWAAATADNYTWLVKQFDELLAQYRHRYYKVHACQKLLIGFVVHAQKIKDPRLKIPRYRTPFANATTYFRHVEDVHLAYRRQLTRKWRNDKRPPRWNRKPLRCSPTQWFKEVERVFGH